MSDFEIFSQVANEDKPAAKATPAQVKAETLYYKVRSGKMSFASAMAKMPRNTDPVVARWACRLQAEFGN